MTRVLFQRQFSNLGSFPKTQFVLPIPAYKRQNWTSGGVTLTALDDFTHGTPTTLPWGNDFVDGIPRHPVQLYESLTMGVFCVTAIIGFERRWPAFMGQGFYILVLVYAAQRFLWEFLKPYGTIAGPLNIFHLTCLGLIVYALVMMTKGRSVVST